MSYRKILVLTMGAGMLSLAACSESPTQPSFTRGSRAVEVPSGATYVRGNPVCVTATSFKIDGIPANGSYYGGVITITDATSTSFSWSSTQPVSALIVKAANGAYVYEYDPAATSGSVISPNTLYNTGANQADISHADFCFGTPEAGIEIDWLLTVQKFYDANANGVYDIGTESLLSPWRIHDDEGDLYFDAPDAFTVAQGYEYAYTESTATGWAATTGETITGTVGAGNVVVSFGNVCFLVSYGRTLGFWSNKNGQRQMGTGSGMSAALSMLNALPLRGSGGGSQSNFTNYSSFRNWLLAATATDMSYMLSAQLAAMVLNVEYGWAESTDLVYAPDVDGASSTGYIELGDLIDEAIAYLEDPGASTRAYGEILKDALDDGNNNRNIVSRTPCPVPTWPVL